MHPWQIVHEPMAEEYPRDKVWNHTRSWADGVKSIKGEMPYIKAGLEHVAQSLDEGITPELRAAGITNGYEYLMTWVAYAIQRPYQRLPFLCFYSSGRKHAKDFLRDVLQILLHTDVFHIGDDFESSFNGHLESCLFRLMSEVGIAGLDLSLIHI